MWGGRAVSEVGRCGGAAWPSITLCKLSGQVSGQAAPEAGVGEDAWAWDSSHKQTAEPCRLMGM